MGVLRNTWSADAFKSYVEDVFLALQRAWSEGRADDLRPHETDNLFQQHRFWLERYRRAGYQNKLEDIAVDGVELVKFEKDAFYEAVTARIRARMVDYTVDSSGEVVAGSKKRRKFSEYWTFLRRAGVEVEVLKDKKQCPECAAELKLNKDGICEYCSARVTSGRFYWVLSAIEQDEAYGG